MRTSLAAEKLGAAHRAANGWNCVIVGQAVAEQLVCDQMKALLRQAREYAKRTENAAAAGGGNADSAAPVHKDALEEERRREREERQEARREQPRTTPSSTLLTSSTSPD